MHAGGVLADALVPNQTAASMRAVFSPKVYPSTLMLVPLHCNYVTGPCTLYSCAMMGFQEPQVAKGSVHYQREASPEKGNGRIEKSLRCTTGQWIFKHDGRAASISSSSDACVLVYLCRCGKRWAVKLCGCQCCYHCNDADSCSTGQPIVLTQARTGPRLISSLCP